MYRLEVGQRDDRVPGADTLHHVVAAVLTPADQRRRPHLPHSIITTHDNTKIHIT